MSDVLSFEDENFNNFAFYSALVLGKTWLMSPLISFCRVKNKVFVNPEDIAGLAPGSQINTNHPTVERLRRCHQNDLESVVPFTLIGLIYVSASPHPEFALRIFRVYAASRMLHTVAYLLPLRQPARVLSFYAGWGATGMMVLFIIARFTFMK